MIAGASATQKAEENNCQVHSKSFNHTVREDIILISTFMEPCDISPQIVFYFDLNMISRIIILLFPSVFCPLPYNCFGVYLLVFFLANFFAKNLQLLF